MYRIVTILPKTGRGLIYTSHPAKYSQQIAAADTQKEAYYPNLDSTCTAAYDEKPAGWDEAKPYSEIPGPKPYPIVGNVWRFFPFVGNLHNMDVVDLHKKMRDEYGNIVALKGIPATKDMVWLFSPEDTEIVHRNEGVFPLRDSLEIFTYYRTVVRKDVFQDVGGLTAMRGKEWHNLRTKVNPLILQPESILKYVDHMDRVSHDLVARMRNLINNKPEGELPDDFLNYLYRWALESVATVAIDKRLGCLNENPSPGSEQETVINSGVEMFRLYHKLEILPSMWKLFGGKRWNRFVEVSDNLTFTFLKYINEAKAKSNAKRPQNEKKMSVLEHLLKIDDKSALAIAMDMLTAGVDTTGKTSGAALYFLSKNPEVQDKLRKEIYSLLPNKDSPVTEEVLAKAGYLNAVIKEVIRMAPIAIGVIRTTVKDLVLCGYQVPKGVNILTSNLLMCRSDEHFHRAKEFIPERWLKSTDGELSYKNTHPFTYIPFGFGPRSCLGQRLAKQELKVAVAKVVRNFSLEWHHEDMIFRSLPMYGIGKPLKLYIKELEE